MSLEQRLRSQRRLQSIRRHDAWPSPVTFHTSTLRYNSHGWLTVNGLDTHWQPASVTGEIGPPSQSREGIDVVLTVHNVNDLSFHFPAGTFLPGQHPCRVNLAARGSEAGTDGPVMLIVQGAQSDGSCSFRIHRAGGFWTAGTSPWEGELRKRHGLQGPIDDALMDSFVFVKSSGTCRHPQVEAWTTSEFERAAREWRRQMRGDARVKADVDITDEDIARHNLILWGDPSSNRVIARIADRLPIHWGEKEVIVGNRRFAAEHHAAILIYPNPLNPEKYVVLNSSFTYREYDYLNNARQAPKLPDWAVVDLRVMPDSRWPGKIVDADFFDEGWQLQKPFRQREAGRPR